MKYLKNSPGDVFCSRDVTLSSRSLATASEAAVLGRGWGGAGPGPTSGNTNM